MRERDGFTIDISGDNYVLCYFVAPPAGRVIVSPLGGHTAFGHQLGQLGQVMHWMRAMKPGVNARLVLHELLPHRAAEIDDRVCKLIENKLLGEREDKTAPSIDTPANWKFDWLNDKV